MRQEPLCDDPYGILEITPAATPDEIRAAHRRLVRRFHPDANRDDPAAAKRFDAVQQAYRLLRDGERRRRWDQRHARAVRPAAQSDSTTPSRQTSPNASSRAATGVAEPASSPRQQAPRGPTPGDRATEGSFYPRSGDADEIEVDVELPIDELWSTAAPSPAKVSGIWKKFPKWRWAFGSARAIFVSIVIGIGLTGVAMMAMQVMPLLGAIVLVSAPVSLYVVERTGVLA